MKKQQLTNREKQVCRWLSKGMTYKEISLQLKISIRTAQTHLYNAKRKLRAKTKTEAVALFVKGGAK